MKATECPHIRPAFLEEQRSRLGKLFAREYMCEFLDLGGTMFDREAVDRSFTKDVLPLPLQARLNEWLRR